MATHKFSVKYAASGDFFSENFFYNGSRHSNTLVINFLSG